KAVKFESVEANCEKLLYNRLMELAIKDMQHQLAFEARTKINIIHPVLAKQWQEKLDRDTNAKNRRDKELHKDQIRKDQHRVSPDAPEKTPSRTAPTGDVAPRADIAPAGERPPATQPG